VIVDRIEEIANDLSDVASIFANEHIYGLMVTDSYVTV